MGLQRARVQPASSDAGRDTATYSLSTSGMVPKKFNAVELSRLVNTERSNQGINFKIAPHEGLGPAI